MGASISFDLSVASSRLSRVSRFVALTGLTAALLLAAGCDGRPSVEAIRRKATQPGQVQIVPNGYTSHICINGQGCIPAVADGIFTLAPGTYSMSAPSVFDGNIPTPLGTFTIDGAGKVVVHPPLDKIFKQSGEDDRKATLTAEVRQINFDFQGYGGLLQIGGHHESISPDFHSATLLVGLRYKVHAHYTLAIDGNFEIPGFVELSPEGVLSVAGGAADTFVADGLTLVAQVKEVTFDLAGYPGQIVAGRYNPVVFGTQNKAKLLKGRRHEFMSHNVHRLDALTGEFGEGHDIGVNTDGSLYLSDGARAYFTASGFALRARVTPVTFNLNGYANGLGILHTTALSGTVNLIVGRRYAVNVTDGLMLTVPFQGACDPAPLGGSPVTATCTIDQCGSQPNGTRCGGICSTESTCQSGACVAGPSRSCEDSDPCTTDTCSETAGCVHGPRDQTCATTNVPVAFNFAGYKGPICVAGVCATPSTPTVTVPAGSHAVIAPATTRHDGVANAIGILTVHPNGALVRDANLQRHLQAEGTGLKANTAQVTLDFNGYAGPIGWHFEYLYGPGTTTTWLLTDRGYTLFTISAQDLYSDRLDFSLEPGRLWVGTNGVLTIDTQMQRSFFPPTGSTLKARVAEVRFAKNGHPMPVGPRGHSSFPAAPATLKLLTGRRYDLTTDHSAGPDGRHHVPVSSVRIQGRGRDQGQRRRPDGSAPRISPAASTSGPRSPTSRSPPTDTPAPSASRAAPAAWVSVWKPT